MRPNPVACPDAESPDPRTAAPGDAHQLVNAQQLAVIEYLREEDRMLREQLGPKRLHFTDDQRRCLAANGKRLGRRV